MHSYGSRLKVWRESQKLKQPEAASLLGVPASSYQKYEMDLLAPGAKAIEGFVRAGINANWLVTGEGEMQLRMGAPLGLALRVGMAGAAAQPEQLLAELGVSHEQMQAYQEGSRIPEATFLLRFSELTGYPLAKLSQLHELATTGLELQAALGKAQSAVQASKNEPVPGYVAIPLFNDVRAAAGAGAINGCLEKPDDALMFKADWIRFELGARPEDLNLIRVSGDSMEPTLRAGDVVLIDHRAQRPDREGIYILRLGEMLLVKRLQALPGGMVRVVSDNPAFAPWEISLEKIGSDMAIIGRVVWSGRRH